ncbi:MAG: hypothetical protein PUC48_09035, partial [Paraprevotella sp.]|nr:hypothetical protein [Paraprevotella sp.]
TNIRGHYMGIHVNRNIFLHFFKFFHPFLCSFPPKTLPLHHLHAEATFRVAGKAPSLWRTSAVGIPYMEKAFITRFVLDVLKS